MLWTLLIILLVLALFGGIGTGPWWPHSAGWGYYPVGGFGLVLIVLLLVLLLR